MDSQALRQKFINFFVARGHKHLPAASLIPENDPSVLFTTAGMQQFRRFYLHPEEVPKKNVVTCQPCIRTSDIEEVGDETHLTFFEMLGNFSFGGYFKKEAIEYAWEFLTDKKWLGISKKRISATYFDQGKAQKYQNIKTDTESKEILGSLDGLENIKGEGDDNFWSLGYKNSPGGPTVELYVDDIEVWNLVFNEYYFKNNEYESLITPGVDTGMGLERMLVVVNDLKDVYETDFLEPIVGSASCELGLAMGRDENLRIIADHMRAAVMITAEGIRPGKNERESVLRTLIRRSVQCAGFQQIGADWVRPIIKSTVDILGDNYQYIKTHRDDICATIYKEVEIFQRVLAKCEKILKVRKKFSAEDAFYLLQQEGCPIGLYKDYAAMAKVAIKDDDIEKERQKHREISRAGVSGFRGGLAAGGEMETKYHTATHLLLASLRQVLGNDIFQKGSNITAERLRFDFNWPEKLTDEQIRQVEDLVNEQIKKDLPVTIEEMNLEQAKKAAAMGVFERKYGDKVKVYSIGRSKNDYFSREICGGPHVEHTGILGHFRITKEESSSSGVRRIKAVLE